MTTSEFPPPPQELPLDDVNPCDLWTPEQLREFKLKEQPTSSSPSSNGFGGQRCAYFGAADEPQLLYTLNTYPTTGLAEAAERVGPGVRTVPVEVDGFPAARTEASAGDTACEILIGTAGGQHLVASVTVTPNELSMDEFCELSMAAAAAAIENLQEL